jgi:hypothetical protein
MRCCCTHHGLVRAGCLGTMLHKHASRLLVVELAALCVIHCIKIVYAHDNRSKWLCQFLLLARLL